MVSKKFETKATIIRNLFLQTLAVGMGVFVMADILLKSNSEFYQFIEQYSQGTGSTRSTSTIVYVIYKYFGKTGCLMIFSVITIGIVYYWMKEFNKLHRFLHKEKLFKMGLVSDMDDDYKPQGLFVTIKNLFRKSKDSSRKSKIYSRKELRKMEKELSNNKKYHDPPKRE